MCIVSGQLPVASYQTPPLSVSLWKLETGNWKQTPISTVPAPNRTHVRSTRGGRSSTPRAARPTCTCHSALLLLFGKRLLHSQPSITPSPSLCLTFSSHCFPFPRIPPLALLLTALNSKRLRSSFSRKVNAVAGRVSAVLKCMLSNSGNGGGGPVGTVSTLLARPSPIVCGAM